MPKRIRLEPASSVLIALGGKRGGVKVASDITGRCRTQVWRWMQPKEKGGTGGIIPKSQRSVLLAWAKANGKRLDEKMFQPRQ